MRSRKAPLPKLWLMTDERGSNPVLQAKRLPKGSGIVFRHYATAASLRRKLFNQVQRVARKRRLVLMFAGPPKQARAWGADGAHHRSALKSEGVRTVAVHTRAEKTIATRLGADLIFVSPVFKTRSHARAKPLGVKRLGLIIGTNRDRTIALGGLSKNRFRQLSGLGVHGWAGIDAFD